MRLKIEYPPEQSRPESSQCALETAAHQVPGNYIRKKIGWEFTIITDLGPDTQRPGIQQRHRYAIKACGGGDK
jgi:hypothetical protein